MEKAQLMGRDSRQQSVSGQVLATWLSSSECLGTHCDTNPCFPPHSQIPQEDIPTWLVPT